MTRKTKPFDKGNASKFKHVMVVWLDITGKDDAWMDLSEAKTMKPSKMITSGWLLRESDDYIVVASSMDMAEGIVGNINAIPRCVIEAIKKI